MEMTVSQLIEELRRYPGHLPVLVNADLYKSCPFAKRNEWNKNRCPNADVDRLGVDAVIFEGSYLAVEVKP